MRMQDKVAVITGGTSGIGLETARLFQAHGAQLVILSSSEDHLDAASKELGNAALAVQADIRRVSDIERAAKEIEQKFGRVDILFANAGASTVAPLEAITEEYVNNNLALNFSGTLFTIQKFAPLMPQGSSIVVTTSFLNVIGMPGLSVLAATKAAARSLVRTLGAELAPRGIRVNAVSPGAVSTPFYGKMGLTEEQLSGVAAALQEKIPFKRFGEASELAAAVLFFASNDSSYITGTELVVDGGLTQL
ncbi:short-chain dehydrogenase [Bordetella genomosp. 8]|uniref:Short-chain dehydrogenase n=1 Tax=Bordetella genomosp. 8 TaxID=1416806 RepID=A0A1W6YPM2_9BORD|nr:SDR family oxidoreductase [Bordetella genomosp. 8]ARP82958.1 short-chain dehydrogenase [Bordetella genomosp. 8]